MIFNEAFDALKLGKRVTRPVWGRDNIYFKLGVDGNEIIVTPHSEHKPIIGMRPSWKTATDWFVYNGDI